MSAGVCSEKIATPLILENTGAILDFMGGIDLVFIVGPLALIESAASILENAGAIPDFIGRNWSVFIVGPLAPHPVGGIALPPNPFASAGGLRGGDFWGFRRVFGWGLMCYPGRGFEPFGFR